MASAAISEIVTQSANLRAELKEWERAFAAQNGGRKAERSDIKKVPEIGMVFTFQTNYTICLRRETDTAHQ
jgi:hypothetical protein